MVPVSVVTVIDWGRCCSSLISQSGGLITPLVLLFRRGGVGGGGGGVGVGVGGGGGGGTVHSQPHAAHQASQLLHFVSDSSDVIWIQSVLSSR